MDDERIEEMVYELASLLEETDGAGMSNWEMEFIETVHMRLDEIHVCQLTEKQLDKIRTLHSRHVL